MNQGNVIREHRQALDLRGQLGALEDAAEKRAVQGGIFGPAMKVHAVEGDVVRLFRKAPSIGQAIAACPCIV